MKNAFASKEQHALAALGAALGVGCSSAPVADLRPCRGRPEIGRFYDHRIGRALSRNGRWPAIFFWRPPPVFGLMEAVAPRLPSGGAVTRQIVIESASSSYRSSSFVKVLFSLMLTMTDDNAAKKPIVVTIGDVTFDWLCFEVSAGGDEPATTAASQTPQKPWRLAQHIEFPAVHGGAWNVDNCIRTLLGPDHSDSIYCYNRFSTQRLRQGDSRLLLHTLTDFKLFDAEPDAGSDDQVYRVAGRSPRFFGPSSDADGEEMQWHPVLLPKRYADLQEQTDKEIVDCWEPREQDAAEQQYPPQTDSQRPGVAFPDDRRRIVAVFDRGNGFSTHKYARKHADPSGLPLRDDWFNWEYALPDPKRQPGDDPSNVHALVVASKGFLGQGRICTGEPWSGSELWQRIVDHYLDRTILVVEAEDLRRAGVRISKGESWEQSAYDLVSQLRTHWLLKQLSRAAHLVVRFGISGLLHSIHDEDSHFLYFDPNYLEDEYTRPSDEGRMFGYDPVLAGSIVAGIYENILARPDEKLGKDAVDQALAQGMANCRAFFRNGWGRSSKGIRNRVEQWDHKDRQARDYDGTKNLRTLRITTVGAFTPTAPPAADRHAAARPFAQFRFQVDVNDQLDFVLGLRDPSTIVKHVVEELIAACRKNFKDLGAVERDQSPSSARHAQKPDASPPAVEFEFKIEKLQNRIGKGLFSVSFRFPAQFDVGREFYRRLYEQRIPDYFQKSDLKSPDQLQADSNWLREFREVLVWIVQQTHEPISQVLHWQLCAPVRLAGIAERRDFERVRIEVRPDWTILNPTFRSLEEIAWRIVRYGVKRGFEPVAHFDGTAGRFPVARFGALTTVDRQEIESYRSIRKLMQNYKGRTASPRPLSIAVFGPPGSGKSFGVKQIAESVGFQGRDIYGFNLSQFTSTSDLRDALILVRDRAAEGSPPLVFFDEFDSNFDGQPLGWLKYFLSVMQDGKFKYNDSELRIGAAVLVFAGGTSTCYREFAHGKEPTGKASEAFQKAKGPDFVSRLRGFVDILGINPPANWDSKDKVFMIRRALILRSLIEREYSSLLLQKNGAAEAQVDRGVLSALLGVFKYEHGVRSLEAILEMSALTEQRRFAKSNLPPREQLEMHLGADPQRDVVEEFYELLEDDCQE